MISDHLYFNMFATCIPVRGANRSVICDLQRREIQFIPNSLLELLQDYKEKSIGEIKALYGKNNEETIEEYLSFLIKKEYIFLCTKEELKLFPALDLTWEVPNLVENAIIDINKENQHDYSLIFNQLESLGCEAVHLRFFSQQSILEIQQILNLLTKSRIEAIEILVYYSEEWTEDVLTNFANDFPRLSDIIIHSTPPSKMINFKHKFLSVNWTEKLIDSNAHCGIIAPRNFSINVNVFLESQQHNTCLNHKISIDQHGEIKNCPSLPTSYGNIKDISLIDAMKKDGFKKYWLINKDKIEVCKDCEFRHICTDCRAYREDPKNIYSKPLKCGYDPYTNKWEEWSTNPLKQKAIEHYQLKEIISNKETV